MFSRKEIFNYMKISLLHHKEKILVIVLSLSLLCITSLIHVHYDKVSPPYSLRLEAVKRDLIPAELLSYGHFGFKTFLADIYWLRAIQDFVAWNGEELFFLDYFKNISTLDPRFEHPYLFAIWTIPQDRNDIDRLNQVAEVAKRGIETIPTSWQIPYHLGTQYYLFTKSYNIAKEYLKIAAEKKNAPPGVYLNYSSFVINEVKGYKASFDLVKVIYDTTNDETLKKVLGLGLEKEVLTTMLERGILAYKTITGVYPSSLEAMTDKNLVSLPQEFSEKFVVTINNKTGAFKIEERK
jgi:hypothetical protein